MTVSRRPAAYLRACPGLDRQAMSRAARQRGWPAPAIYSDDGSVVPALDRLTAAVSAGRHDAVLLIAGDPVPLMHLLRICTERGGTVSFVPPAAPADPAADTPVTAAAAAAALPDVGESDDVLARARMEALTGLFPAWRFWLDRHGWHARRRADGFLQSRRPGAPAFHVRADTATDLAAQLFWQQAADEHAPDGCQASVPARHRAADASMQPTS